MCMESSYSSTTRSESSDIRLKNCSINSMKYSYTLKTYKTIPISAIQRGRVQRRLSAGSNWLIQRGLEKIELRILSKPDFNEATKETHDDVSTYPWASYSLPPKPPVLTYTMCCLPGRDINFLELLVFSRDITDRKKTEKELNLYREHLENRVAAERTRS